MIASTQTNHPLPAQKSPLRKSSGSAALDSACARLKSAGLRITQPRIAILEALLRQDGPITIEQLHGELSRARCDLVTVYRCLAAFEELGLVQRCFLHNGTALFQINLDADPAYHVISPTNGQIDALDPALAAEISAAMKSVNQRLSARGYQKVTALVEFFAEKSTAPHRAQTALAGVSDPELATR